MAKTKQIIKNEDKKLVHLERLKEFYSYLTPELIDMFYPVGSYMDLYTDEITPADLMPNTDWLPITDGTVRRAAGNNSVVGSDTHTLTINEMPSHGHTVDALYHWGTSANSGANWGIVDHLGEAAQQWVAAMPAGGSQAHNNIQRSQNVYTYRRVPRSLVKEVA